MGCGISQHGESAFEDARYNMSGRQVHYNSAGRLDGHYVRTRTTSSYRQRDEENPAVTAEQTATRLLLHGNALVEKSNFTEAIEAYSKALLYKEDLERVYLERGLAYYKLKELGKAVEDLTVAIKLGTYLQMAYFVRATIYKEQGELNDALSDLTVLVEKYPEHIEAYQLRSSIYQKLGDMEKSLADLEKAGLIEENRYCVVCLENHRETRLHPCLHAVLCTKCATGLCKQNMGCPLCGAAIEHVEFGKFDSTFAFDEKNKLSKLSHKPKTKENLTVPEGAVSIY
ncbi:RING zinc finger domain-containing protein [Chloropicon primus]|uniref:RING-type domain-containing protein n=1 Tax=Chloropicon primus TaxID=1764295 RepID=A0A5B8MML7_9CHLO|nr:hypothetical protein A3770_04p30680 [Chloropicon primus]UPQ99762.1 RING zinc finger domain-containing protein [Chloropicon primus]|eukprot:QDZ20550.1 hypothetical protein A3770_04p30680 [Chloropicon primus]